MSPVHIYQDLPAGCTDSRIKEYVYDLGFGDPEDFLKELLGADEKGLLCLFINLLLLQQHKVIFILLNLEKLIFFYKSSYIYFSRIISFGQTNFTKIFYITFIYKSISGTFNA